jgi:hypothetical protein
MSSNLKVNTIQPSSGDTVSIAGIASITSSVSIASSCTATTFYGDGSNLTGVSGLSVGNQADNRLITCTGTTDSLNGEQYLTYSSQSSLNLTDGNGTSLLGGNYLNLKRTTGNSNYINAPLADAELLISADESIIFKTVHTADFNSTERARIDSSGRLLIGTTTEGHIHADNLTIADSGICGMTIRSGTSSSGNIYFSDGTSGSGEYIGAVEYSHSTNSLQLYVNVDERLRITNDGKVVAGGSGAGYPSRLQSHGAGELLDLNSTSGAGKIRFYESGAGRFNIETLNGAAGIRFLDALNNVEAMRIHANGRITTPNQPMYSGMGYVGQGTQVQTNIYAIRPSAVYANLGSHFDTSTGVFTCPIAGRYLCIGAMGRRTTAFNWNGFYLIHNGATKGDMWFPPARDNGTNPASPAAFRADQFTYNPTNLSAVLTCAANDTLSFSFHSSYAAPLNSSANYAQFILIG